MNNSSSISAKDSICPDNQNLSEFNYEITRKNNMNKIKSYYNETLNKYTTIYEDYLRKSSSGNQDENDEAEYDLNEKGDITELNNHLISIKRNLNELVQEDTKNIVLQKEKIKNENKTIRENKKTINNLYQILNKNEGESNLYSDSYNEMSDVNSNNEIYNIVLIVICVLLLLYVIYLIYSIFTRKSKLNGLLNSINAVN